MEPEAPQHTCLRICFKGLLVVFPLAIIFQIEFCFYQQYLLTAFSSGCGYFNCALNSVLVGLLLWALFQTWRTDPGYT
jgi:hypothetical protein